MKHYTIFVTVKTIDQRTAARFVEDCVRKELERRASLRAATVDHLSTPEHVQVHTTDGGISVIFED